MPALSFLRKTEASLLKRCSVTYASYDNPNWRSWRVLAKNADRIRMHRNYVNELGRSCSSNFL